MALCPRCSKSVLPFEGGITADYRKYHKACFRCTVCSRVLSVSTFDSYQNQIYCKVHRPKASSLLSMCSTNASVDTFVQIQHKSQLKGLERPDNSKLLILSSSSTTSTSFARTNASSSSTAKVSNKHTLDDLISLGQEKAAEIMVAKCQMFDANASDEKGRPLLRQAVEAKRRCEWLVEMLVAAGANVNYKNWQNVTLLHICAETLYEGELSLKNLEVLLASKADVQMARTSTGDTLLHQICKNGRIKNGCDAVRLAIGYGAQVDALNKKQKTPLWYSKRRDISEALIESGANIHIEDKNERTLLHRAVKKNNLDLVQLYLAKGLNPNAQTSCRDRWTPLHVFAGMIDCEDWMKVLVPIGRALVDAGADFSIQDSQGNPALFVTKNLIRSQILLDLGCNPNILNKWHDSKLHTLAAHHTYGSMEIQMLLMNGADPNMKNRLERTPMHIAMALEKVELCMMLVKYGGDLSIPDKNGISPLDLGMLSKHYKTRRLFLHKERLHLKEIWMEIYSSEKTNEFSRLALLSRFIWNHIVEMALDLRLGSESRTHL